MQAFTEGAEPVSLVLNREKLDQLRQKHKIKNSAELAQRIGIDPATLWRLSTGKSLPSNTVIARVILAFPGTKLLDLFTLRRGNADS